MTYFQKIRIFEFNWFLLGKSLFSSNLKLFANSILNNFLDEVLFNIEKSFPKVKDIPPLKHHLKTNDQYYKYYLHLIYYPHFYLYPLYNLG